MAAFAQSGTNSPYSQYGLGVLSDQSQGFNRGMDGLAQGLHDSKQVNFQNPASYASMDSLTFLFDVGLALQITNFTEGNRKLNANNGGIEYAVAGFRAAKNLGMSFGILPFTNIGYNYSTTAKVSEGSETEYTTTNTGSGGLRQLYYGIGWSPIKNLAVGANIGYLFGTTNRSIINSFTDAYANTVSRYFIVDVASYRLDVGAQYTLKVGKQDKVTLGATFTPGHIIPGEVKMLDISSNSQTAMADTMTIQYDDVVFLPHMISGGLAWHHGSQLHIGADYTYQQWTMKQFPAFEGNTYKMSRNALRDRHKITVGGEFVNNVMSRRYLDRVHVRAGFSYATPYINIDTQKGPRELSASIGFGLPITNAWNNRSMLNISAQWSNRSADGFIKENTFRINLGITFNELWFMKWKLK